MTEGFRDAGAISSSAVRINNRVRVLRFLHEAGSATQMDIRNTLRLSGPTVTQTLQLFKEIGLLSEGEGMPSQGGRKPRPLVFRYGAYHSVGVEIRRRHVDVRAVDLAGNAVAGETFRLPYTGDEAYWRAVDARVESVLAKRPEPSPVLGVAVGFPGELSPSGEAITRATVLGITELPVSRIRAGFSRPVRVEYGANAGAFGLVWRTKLQDAVYVIITDNGVAGAVILGNRIFRGKNGQPGAFGHMVLDPAGRPCACGGRGCWAAYVSLGALTGSEEPDLPAFFARLAAGDGDCRARWSRYLDALAQGLANIRLSYDLDVILAGKLTPYLADWEEELNRRIRAYPVLAGEPPFLRLNTLTMNPIAEGAALMLVDSFLSDELDGMHFEERLSAVQEREGEPS